MTGDDLNEKEVELRKAVVESGVVDFKKLGELVTSLTPQLFERGYADDYIASGVSSFVKIFKQ